MRACVRTNVNSNVCAFALAYMRRGHRGHVLDNMSIGRVRVCLRGYLYSQVHQYISIYTRVNISVIYLRLYYSLRTV